MDTFLKEIYENWLRPEIPSHGNFLDNVIQTIKVSEVVF